jgi:hypothetical protein
MPMHVLVPRRLEIATLETSLQKRRELGVYRKEVLVLAMLGATLTDQKTPVFFHDLRRNLRRSIFENLREPALPGDDGVAKLDDTTRAQRVRIPRPTKGRLGALVALE